jgi:hypothetical protein
MPRCSTQLRRATCSIVWQREYRNRWGFPNYEEMQVRDHEEFKRPRCEAIEEMTAGGERVLQVSF